MNKIILMGRLTRNAEIKISAGSDNKVARFRMALNGRNDRTDFVDCVAFKGRAEILEKYGTKGKKIAVIAHFGSFDYVNKEGKKVYSTDVVVDEIEFVESKRSEFGSLDVSKNHETDDNNDKDFHDAPLDDIPSGLPFN